MFMITMISLDFQWFSYLFRLWLVVLQRLKFSMVTAQFGEPLTSYISQSNVCKISKIFRLFSYSFFSISLSSSIEFSYPSP